MNYVGTIDWQGCDECRKYLARRGDGGCDPIDKEGKNILEVDLEMNVVRCTRFERGNREPIADEHP